MPRSDARKGETMLYNEPWPAKGKRAETLRQARTFDSNKKHYAGLGLCSPCAAQAAWGHQVGFSGSKPPCQKCQPIVDTFPVVKGGKWRSSSPRCGAKLSTRLRPETEQERP